MSIDMTYFQNFEFILKREDSFELIISEEELDEFYTFNGYWDVIQVADKLGFEEEFRQIVPYVHSFDFYLTTEEKAEYEKMLIHPKKCLELNNKLKIFDKILEVHPEYSVYLKSILNNWNKNRYVVVHYE